MELIAKGGNMSQSGRRHGVPRRSGTISLAGVAVLCAVTLGLTPSMAAVPNTYFVRGTNIGGVSPDSLYTAWVDQTVGATAGAHGAPIMVDYPGGFWPASKGYLGAPTYGDSVDQGLESLAATIAAGGDNDNSVIIHGYSQGAVVVTEYMRAHPGVGNTYVLVGNPNRPNGGILQRFNGFYIPLLDVPFNGATPTDGDPVLDIAYRYDGWADFPKHPLNVLATANALMGILYLHGKAEQNVNAETLAAAEQSTHGNTTYYLLDSARLPLLMPFQGVLPNQLLDALETPLRSVIETAYDRSDYGEPTRAQLLPPITTPQAAPTPTPALRPAAADAETVDPASDDKPAQKRRATKNPNTTHSSDSGTDTTAPAGRQAPKSPDGDEKSKSDRESHHRAAQHRDSKDSDRDAADAA